MISIIILISLAFLSFLLGCSMLIWAMKNNNNEASGPVLMLACFVFLIGVTLPICEAVKRADKLENIEVKDVLK
jgi:hypothetical protein